MKSTIVVLAVCFIQAFGDSVVDTEKKELIEIKSCLSNYGINNDFTFDDMHNLSNHELGCVSACLYKKDGVMLSDGTVSESVAKSRYSVNFVATYNSCKEGKKHCELAECLLSAFERK